MLTGQGAGYYGITAAELCGRCLAAVVILTVVGITVPKRLCTSGKIGERFILSASGAYSVWIALFMPLVWLVEVISKGILRLLGVKKPADADAVTEEEILLMVDAVNETGGIEESQAEMISNIFEFDDTQIKDAMTHRTEIVGVEENEDIKQVIRLAIEEGKSRLPVYSENMDNICGVVCVKDLLGLALENDGKFHCAREYMRDMMFVPESNKCGELFEEFTRTKTQIAAVVDEYGGTAGIITMEDLLETIVGSIQDEYDDEEEQIKKVSEDIPSIFSEIQTLPMRSKRLAGKSRRRWISIPWADLWSTCLGIYPRRTKTQSPCGKISSSVCSRLTKQG